MINAGEKKRKTFFYSLPSNSVHQCEIGIKATLLPSEILFLSFYIEKNVYIVQYTTYSNCVL